VDRTVYIVQSTNEALGNTGGLVRKPSGRGNRKFRRNHKQLTGHGMRTLIAALVLAASGTTGTLAETVDLTQMAAGYTYYNRPGASVFEAQDAIRHCAADVAPSQFTNKPDYSWNNASIKSAYFWSNIGGKQIFFTNIENCLVVRGWRVVRISDDEGAALLKLPAAELSVRLEPWTGAQSPHGTIERSWKNDAALASTVKTFRVPRPIWTISNQVPLTLNTMASVGDMISLVRENPQKGPTDFKTARPVDETKLVAIPKGFAVIVLQLRNSTPQGPSYLRLVRLGSDGVGHGAIQDKLPDQIFGFVPKDQKYHDGEAPKDIITTYIVPPGRWSINMVSDVMSVCLRSPFFNIVDGEVVYTGVIDFGSDGLLLDDSKSTAASTISGNPFLAARLKPARWENGPGLPCSYSFGYNYALEFPSAP
jgi:hypothetical protein